MLSGMHVEECLLLVPILLISSLQMVDVLFMLLQDYYVYNILHSHFSTFFIIYTYTFEFSEIMIPLMIFLIE